MEIINDAVWFCNDCTMYAVNGDLSGIEDEDRSFEVASAYDGITGVSVVPNFTEDDGGSLEFSSRQCECCLTTLAGGRHRFAYLR